MELSVIVLKQTITMFILMTAGYILYKAKVITNACSRELSKMLITVVIPCVIIQSYAVPFSSEKFRYLLMAGSAAAISLVVAMAICHVVYGRRKKIENFGVSFSNAGFVGIPLVSAVLGQEAVFYVSIYVALLNLLQQTYGVMVLTENAAYIKPRKIFLNPILCALVIGLGLFFFPIEVPGIMKDCIGYIAGLNTPVAMIILGVYLAQSDMRDMVLSLNLYGGSAIRLVVIPLVTILVLAVLPMDSTIKMIELIAAATPIGSNVAVFAQLHNQDYNHAAKMVCNSTLLSILTLPIMVGIASFVF